MSYSKNSKKYKKYKQLIGTKSIILFYYDLLKNGIIKKNGAAHNRMQQLQDKLVTPLKSLEKIS